MFKIPPPIKLLAMHKCIVISSSIIGLIGLILTCLPVPQPELTMEQKLQNPAPEQQTALINSMTYQSYEFKRCMAGAGILGSTILVVICYLFYDSCTLRHSAHKVVPRLPPNIETPSRPQVLARPPTPPRPKTAKPTPFQKLTPIEIIEHI